MQKLFGTDGIRDIASSKIFTSKSLCVLAKAIAHFVQLNNPEKRSTILIGSDGRSSGINIQDHFVHWLVLNNIKIAFCEFENVSPENLPLAEKMRKLSPNTIISTPLLSHIVKKYFDFGIMITASHNPHTDNGIKFFDSEGKKLTLDDENKIEELYLNPNLIQPQKNINLQSNLMQREKVILDDEELKIYKQNFNLKNLKLVIDCANGGTSFLASKIFNDNNQTIINNEPNGININDNCGSEYPKELSKIVLENNCDVGIAFDGDGDRAVFIDELGKILSGDHILAICADFFKKNGFLTNNTVVITTMSNQSLISFFNELDINVIVSEVGDRNVLYKMIECNSILGGENSGHFIFRNFSSCGDGILSALVVLDIINKSGKKLSELSAIYNPYPQKIINVRIAEKPSLNKFYSLQKIIKKAEKELGNEGRIFIRYSGTEPICRVMIEGKNEKILEKYSEIIPNEIRSLIGFKS